MLPDALFTPLDLHDVIADAERAHGPSGVVDLLAAALTDPRVRCDSDIDRYLDPLKAACRQTRRHGELIPVLRRVAELNPFRRHEVSAELALVHAHLKETGRGLALLTSAYAEQRALPIRERSTSFCVVAEIAAAVLGQPELGRDIAAMGRAMFVLPDEVTAEPLFSVDEVDAMLTRPQARSRTRPALARAA